MTGELTANLAAMPPLNVALVFAGVVAVIASVTFAARYLNIRSVGPIKREQESYAVVNEMSGANADLDDNLQAKLRDYTDESRVALVNGFDEVTGNGILRRALSSAMRFPMYKSINNNHFTRVLMPGRIGEYRERILRQLKNEYVDLQIAAKAEGSALRPWEQGGSKAVEEFLDQWIRYAKAMTKETCLDKVQSYAEYRGQLTADYWVRMTDSLIEKNRRYAEALT